MTGISTVTTKGQVTIPYEIRNLIGLQSGDSVIFDVEPRQKTVRIRKTKSIVDELAGSLQTDMKYEDIQRVRKKAGKMYGKRYDITP